MTGLKRVRPVATVPPRLFARLPSALLPAVLLAGCSLAPPHSLPEPPVPQELPQGDAYLLQSEAALPSVDYTDVFRDPRFLQLVVQALDNNRDMRIALANVQAARANARIARSAQFPSISAPASASYSTGGDQPSSQSFGLRGGITSFELDLFGRLANAAAAERDRMLATEAASRTLRNALISDLAFAWALHAADSELLAVARDTAANARRSVELTRQRLEGGIAPRTDVRQAEQVLATAEADVAAQIAALAQDENLIRLLIGAEFDRALLPQSLPEVAASIETLPAGTSSQVLLRRPDIIEAEYRLRAANADIGVARARLFPTLSLSGLAGLASDTLSELFNGDSFRATASGDASIPIFDAGGRRAGVAFSEAQRDAALAAYEGAIQSAFREVADVLALQGTLAEQLRAAQANSDAAADNAQLAEARYRGGVESFLANLDAQRSLYAARQREIATNLSAIGNRIDLYRALGTTPQPTPEPTDGADPE